LAAQVTKPRQSYSLTGKALAHNPPSFI